MDPDFESRLARRKEQVRHRTLVRRRIMLGSFAVALVAAAILPGMALDRLYEIEVRRNALAAPTRVSPNTAFHGRNDAQTA